MSDALRLEILNLMSQILGVLNLRNIQACLINKATDSCAEQSNKVIRMNSCCIFCSSEYRLSEGNSAHLLASAMHVKKFPFLDWEKTWNK